MAASTPPAGSRERYIDTVRALAIVRVFLHHSLWFGWMTVVFPSMPIMFGLAGYLTAVSLDRGGAARVITSRIRRLLPPLWALAVVAVPLMLAYGWPDVRWTELGYWVLPLANPPSSAWGGPFAMALWYLRAYLWLVLLSPLLWWAFRRRPVLTLILPAAGAVLMSSPLVTVPQSRLSDVLWSTATYGTCWVLGFARHTRLLDRVPVWACAAGAGLLAAAGMAWSLRATGAPLLGVPAAEMLWGIAFVLVALRLRPSFGWLGRLPVLSAVVTLLNARAVTIYVWHLPMLYAAGALVPDGAPLLGLGAIFTLVAVMATGWVEDVAARRRPVLLPGVRWSRPDPVRPPRTPLAVAARRTAAEPLATSVGR